MTSNAKDLLDFTKGSTPECNIPVRRPLSTSFAHSGSSEPVGSVGLVTSLKPGPLLEI